MKRVGWVAMTGAVLVSLVAVGAEVNRVQPVQPMTAYAPAMEQPAATITGLSEVQPLQRATHLLALPVRNVDQSLRGHVRDIVLSPDRTHVEFLAVAFGGLGDRITRVPFTGLQITSDGRELVCDLRRDQVDLASSFPIGSWPTEYATRRVSQLLALRVHDTSGGSVARIRDLLVDAGDGHVAEATLGMGGFLGIRERLASIEWTSVRISETGRYAEVLMGATALKGMAYRESDYWQRLGFGGEENEPPFEHPMKQEPPRMFPDY